MAQDIHERADSAHINYQELSKIFQHSDILFRFQRILTIQGKACKDLSESILKRQPYKHNKRFKHTFENLKQSLGNYVTIRFMIRFGSMRCMRFIKI